MCRPTRIDRGQEDLDRELDRRWHRTQSRRGLVLANRGRGRADVPLGGRGARQSSRGGYVRVPNRSRMRPALGREMRRHSW
jgi:hypothetical protein